MCTYIGIGLRGEVSVEAVWPFRDRPAFLKGGAIPAPPGKWRFFEIESKYCHCGAALGETARSTPRRKTPKGWDGWSEGKRARWLAETEDADARPPAVSEYVIAELDAWASALRGMLARPGVTGVGIFHQFGSFLLEEPIRASRRAEGDLAKELGDLKEDVFLWIER